MKYNDFTAKSHFKFSSFIICVKYKRNIFLKISSIKIFKSLASSSAYKKVVQLSYIVHGRKFRYLTTIYSSNRQQIHWHELFVSYHSITQDKIVIQYLNEQHETDRKTFQTEKVEICFFCSITRFFIWLAALIIPLFMCYHSCA